MDKFTIEKFYNTLKDGENLYSAISIRNMLNELPRFLAERLRDKYLHNYEPFDEISILGTSTSFQFVKIDGFKFKLCICYLIDYIYVVFSNDLDNEDEDEDLNVLEYFKNLKSFEGYSIYNNNKN